MCCPNQFEPEQRVIACQEDAESGGTIGFYGTVVRCLAESRIRYPDEADKWVYRVSVPYFRRTVNVPGNMLVAIDMLDENKSEKLDWLICFDSIPADDNQSISGSFKLPNSGATFFKFKKSAAEVASYKLKMQMDREKPEFVLIYDVPRQAKLDANYVRDAIRTLIGFRCA